MRLGTAPHVKVAVEWCSSWGHLRPHFSSLNAIITEGQALFVSRHWAVSTLPHGVPTRSPFLFRTKLFRYLFPPTLYPDGLHFSALMCWSVFNEWPVVPSPAACHPIPSLSSSLRRPMPPLQVTLTHNAQSSCQRAICLSTYFSISGLTRHKMRPRLSRSPVTTVQPFIC